MKTAAAALGALERKSVGPQDSHFEQDQEALETEKTQPQVILDCLQAVQQGRRGYI